MLTPPFATTADLTARWRTLTTAETARASVLLTDASQMILDEDKRGVLSALTTPTTTHIRIACKMVERAMGTDVDMGAVTQFSQTMGSFTEQRTLAGPSGDLYLTKAERRQLGFSRQRAGSVATHSVPAPVVSSLLPATGPAAGGTAVTIAGAWFTWTTGVTFGGTAATSWATDGDGTIVATAPAHAAGAVTVVVTTESGPSTTGPTFLYV